MICPLCSSSQQKFKVNLNHEGFSRDFYQCHECDLIFVKRENCISPEEEVKRYNLHDNSIRSEGYLNFLSRLIEIIHKNIHDKNKKGLDYGSGPYPMLLELLSEQGFKNIIGYDPFFNKNQNYRDEKYSFITVCEVIEHVNEPKIVIEELIGLLEDGGVMVWSTGIFKDQDLSRWHYVKDATHINFFSLATAKWIATEYGLEWEHPGKDLIVFWKR